MLKKYRSALIFIAFALTWCFSATNAFALVCYIGSDTEATKDTDVLNAAAYLGNKGNGTRVWTSRVFTRNVTCRSELINGGSENVYVYPYPKRDSQQFPSNIQIGLIFNGEDLGTFDTSGSVSSSKVDTGWVVKNAAESRVMTFQIYMVKTGTISTTGVNEVTVFQLDGLGGLNATDGSNYNITVSGWDNIGSVNCTGSQSANNTTLSGFRTQDILTGSTTQTASSGIKMSNIICSGSSATVINSIKSLVTVVNFSGAPFTGNSDYFATDKTELGLAIKAEGKNIIPGKGAEFEVPLTAGQGSKSIPLEITPHLTSLKFNQPEWLFSEKPASVSSSLNYSYSITDVHLN